MKYGSRHPKRTIGKALLHPMSNLIATQQVRGGDLIKVDFDFENSFDLGAAVLRMSSVRDECCRTMPIRFKNLKGQCFQMK